MQNNIEVRNRIQQEAYFLEKKGYAKIEDDDSINYNRNNILISIIFPPNFVEEDEDVQIRFLDKNQVFSIGWIALVREGIKGTGEKNLTELLQYIKEKYENIIDYHFCKESDKLIEQYVEQNRAQFEKSVTRFLEELEK